MLELVIGIIVGILAIFGLNFRNKSKEIDQLDKRKDKITDGLKKVDSDISDIEKNGPADLNDNEVVDYWKDK